MGVVDREVAGVYLGLPDSEYHSQNWCVSSSFLKTMMTRDAQTARWEKDHPKDSPSFAFGRAFHSIILGTGTLPELKLDGRTKAGKEQAARAAEGIPVLSEGQMETLDAMVASARAHPTLSLMLDGSVRESSIFWQDEKSGVWCSCRPDSLTPQFCVDLKTTDDARPAAFGRSAANYGYPLQAAFYLRGIKAVLGEEPRFIFAATSKSGPFQTALYELDPGALREADQAIDILLEEVSECLETGEWPGVPESINRLQLPKWYDFSV